MKTEYTKKIMVPTTGKKTKPDEIEVKDKQSTKGSKDENDRKF